MAKLKPKPVLHPGVILNADYLEPYDISQNQLAVAMGVPLRRINQIVHGRRRITADTAIRLEILFATPAEYWMRLQSDYELALAHRRGVHGVNPRSTYGRPMEE